MQTLLKALTLIATIAAVGLTTNAQEAKPAEKPSERQVLQLKKTDSDRLIGYLTLRNQKQREIDLLTDAMTVIGGQILRDLGLDPAKWQFEFNEKTRVMEVVRKAPEPTSDR